MCPMCHKSDSSTIVFGNAYVVIPPVLENVISKGTQLKQPKLFNLIKYNKTLLETRQDPTITLKLIF